MFGPQLDAQSQPKNDPKDYKADDDEADDAAAAAADDDDDDAAAKGRCWPHHSSRCSIHQALRWRWAHAWAWRLRRNAMTIEVPQGV